MALLVSEIVRLNLTRNFSEFDENGCHIVGANAGLTCRVLREDIVEHLPNKLGELVFRSCFELLVECIGTFLV